jgi:hypothetical protein
MVLIPAFRTSERPERRRSVVLAIASAVLRRDGPFATDADYSDAVKCECARLRVPYAGLTVADAVALVRARRAGQGGNG